MSERRVVITGMGVVSPIGIGLDSFWSSLIDGKSGIQRISSLDPSDFYCQIGGEVNEFFIRLSLSFFIFSAISGGKLYLSLLK